VDCNCGRKLSETFSKSAQQQDKIRLILTGVRELGEGNNRKWGTQVEARFFAYMIFVGLKGETNSKKRNHDSQQIKAKKRGLGPLE